MSFRQIRQSFQLPILLVGLLVLQITPGRAETPTRFVADDKTFTISTPAAATLDIDHENFKQWTAKTDEGNYVFGYYIFPDIAKIRLDQHKWALTTFSKDYLESTYNSETGRSWQVRGAEPELRVTGYYGPDHKDTKVPAETRLFLDTHTNRAYTLCVYGAASKQAQSDFFASFQTREEILKR